MRARISGNRSVTRVENSNKPAQRCSNESHSLPPSLNPGTGHALLNSFADRKVYNIVHLIYRTKHYEGDSKDYEFSRLSMEEHWQAGYHDATRTLRHPEVLERPTNPEGVSTFDLAQDSRE